MNKQVKYTKDELKEIESNLEELSMQMIDIFKKYRAEGAINEEEYQQHVKVKENFLTYLNNKKENN
ncbi:MAG: hypothetical protein JJT76_17240 [Clostridiaceae bacterium]|nr:hypothetical protein [Clostridiaceae bacterium]